MERMKKEDVTTSTETPKGAGVDSKMMDIIRSKLAGNSKDGKSVERKRTFSEMNGQNDGDLESSKRSRNEEYERLKQQLLAKQQGINGDDDGDDGSKDDEDGNDTEKGAVDRLNEQREEYIKK